MSNTNKGFLNSTTLFSKNQEKYIDKSYGLNNQISDNMTLYNKTNNFRFTNLTNNKSISFNPNCRKSDFISTKNSNLISTNYKTQTFSNNYKESNNNQSMKSLAENKNSIFTNSKFKLTDSNIINRDSINVKKSKAKKNISNDINQIIKSIYNYSDVSTENSNIFEKNKRLEKIIEESSPSNNKKFFLGKNGKNVSKDKLGENKNSDKQSPKINLSLMEKYLISTDYSMNLNYKMR